MYKPSEEAMEAVERLRSLLTDAHTGKITEQAEDVMHALKRALVEGKNAWWVAAEERLEALSLSPGVAAPGVDAAGEKALREVAEDALDCLQERLWAAGGDWGRERILAREGLFFSVRCKIIQ